MSIVEYLDEDTPGSDWDSNLARAISDLHSTGPT